MKAHANDSREREGRDAETAVGGAGSGGGVSAMARVSRGEVGDGAVDAVGGGRSSSETRPSPFLAEKWAALPLAPGGGGAIRRKRGAIAQFGRDGGLTLARVGGAGAGGHKWGGVLRLAREGGGAPHASGEAMV